MVHHMIVSWNDEFRMLIIKDGEICKTYRVKPVDGEWWWKDL